MSDVAGRPEGPPPTPHERRRLARRRRRRVLTVVLVPLVLVGAVAVALATRGPTGDAVGPDGPTPAPPRAPAGPVTPDLEGLAPTDRALAEVLVAVDTAERAMIAFQDASEDAFGAVDDPDDVDAALEAVSRAARRTTPELDAVAATLGASRPDGPAEAARAAYLPHLDAWRGHLARIGADPYGLLDDVAEQADILAINVTADAFRRSVEALLDDPIDPAVRAFAAAILDRGFRGDDRTPAV